MYFYKSFYDLATFLPDGERQNALTAMLDYFFEGIEPTGLSEGGQKVFNACQGRIRKAKACATSGSLGGRANVRTHGSVGQFASSETSSDPSSVRLKHKKKRVSEKTGFPEKIEFANMQVESLPPSELLSETSSDPWCSKSKKYLSTNNPIAPYGEIVDFLNEKAGSRYRSNTPKTKRLIDARLAEGFTLEDFKTVIENMTLEWGHDRKMAPYLRPETLFGTKFEGYLNRAITKSGGASDGFDAYE